MTAAVTIEVRDDAQEVRQQAAAAAPHGLVAGLKAAFLDRAVEPDPTTSACIPTVFAGADDGASVIGVAYEDDVIG